MDPITGQMIVNALVKEGVSFKVLEKFFQCNKVAKEVANFLRERFHLNISVDPSLSFGEAARECGIELDPEFCEKIEAADIPTKGKEKYTVDFSLVLPTNPGFHRAVVLVKNHIYRLADVRELFALARSLDLPSGTQLATQDFEREDTKLCISFLDNGRSLYRDATSHCLDKEGCSPPRYFAFVINSSE